MWDVKVITRRTILANRLERVLRGKEEKTCLLIDIATPDDSNVNTKENEKLSKYKDLEIEVSRMWKLRTKIVPIMTGDLATTKKGLDRNLQLLPGHPSTI